MTRFPQPIRASGKTRDVALTPRELAELQAVTGGLPRDEAASERISLLRFRERHETLGLRSYLVETVYLPPDEGGSHWEEAAFSVAVDNDLVFSDEDEDEDVDWLELVERHVESARAEVEAELARAIAEKLGAVAEELGILQDRAEEAADAAVKIFLA